MHPTLISVFGFYALTLFTCILHTVDVESFLLIFTMKYFCLAHIPSLLGKTYINLHKMVVT